MYRNKNWKLALGVLIGILIVLGIVVISIKPAWIFSVREDKLFMKTETMGREARRPEFAASARMMAREFSVAAESESARLPSPVKIIKTANLSMIVKAVQEAVEQAKQIVESLEGYVTYARVDRTPDNYFYGEATLKIPSRNFDSALAGLEKLGRVDSRNIKAEDVSEEYMDLAARLRNFKKQEESLLNLFKRSGKIGEILEVERELARIRTEIDRIQGRLRVLKNLISYSTIHVSFSQIREAIPEAAISFMDVMKEAWNSALLALARIFSGLLVFLIWTVVFVPLLIVILMVLGLSIFLIRRRPSTRT